jgi:hypothetical protein
LNSGRKGFSWDPANRRQKLGLVWKKERKLAKLLMTTFAYHSSSYLFYARNIPPFPLFPYLKSKIQGKKTSTLLRLMSGFKLRELLSSYHDKQARFKISHPSL